MKKLNIYFAIILVIIFCVYFYKIVFGALAIIICLVLILIINAIINDYFRNKRLKKFRKENCGKHYIWYSSNKRMKTIIESIVLPSINCEVIYNNRCIIQSELNEEVLRYLRQAISHYKFPIIIRIEEDKINANSLFFDIQNYKNKHITEQILVNKLKEKFKQL